MSTPPQTARIDGIVATEANKAVVFRRGPSKLCLQLMWDFDSDAVTAGQWLSGRIYTRRCDISPDARYLVIAATNYSQSHRDKNQHPTENLWECAGWTAISRPPYFTAIGLWFSGGAWNGGGIWKSNSEIALNPAPGMWRAILKPPKRIRVTSLGFSGSEDEPIFSTRLRARGWVERREEETTLVNPGWMERTKDLFDILGNMGRFPDMEAINELIEESSPKWKTEVSGLMEKPFARGFLRRETWAIRERWSVYDENGVERRAWAPKAWHPQWVDVDGQGRIVFGEHGCLWAWSGFPEGEIKLVADLNPYKFEGVAAPDWAKEW